MALYHPISFVEWRRASRHFRWSSIWGRARNWQWTVCTLILCDQGVVRYNCLQLLGVIKKSCNCLQNLCCFSFLSQQRYWLRNMTWNSYTKPELCIEISLFFYHDMTGVSLTFTIAYCMNIFFCCDNWAHLFLNMTPLYPKFVNYWADGVETRILCSMNDILSE